MTTGGQGGPDPISRWLIEAGIMPAPGEEGAPPDTSTWATADRGDPRGIAYAAAKLRGIADRLAAMAPDSGRNQALNYGGYKLAQHAAAGWIDRQQVWDTLFDAALRSGLPRREAWRTLKSAMESGQTRPEDPKLPPDRPGFDAHGGDNPGDEYTAGFLAQLDRSRRAAIERGEGGQHRPPRAQDRPGEPTSDLDGFPDGADGPGPSEGVAPGYATLPDEFWGAREILTWIRHAARYEGQAPDVVFHAVLAKVAALRTPELRVDSGLGTASLNYYALLVGPSGEGKTRGARKANELLPTPARVDDFEGVLPLGTGEGIGEAYMGWESVVTTDTKGRERTVKIRKKIRDHVMFAVDEGERLLRLDERAGSTSGETLRSAWSGAGIGAKNAKEETTRIIPDNSYSLGMVVGIQPHLAAEIVTGQDSGSPQRFVWASIDDPTAPEHRPEPPGEIPWQADVLTKWVRMDMPQWIKDMLWREQWLRKTRQAPPLPPLDSQKPVTLIKLAGLLALLDSRVDVNDEDWALAQVVWDTSCAVRDAIVEMARAKVARERAERDDRTIALKAEMAAETAVTEDRLRRMAVRINSAVRQNGAMSRTEIAHLFAGGKDLQKNERRFARMALEYAEGRDWVITSSYGVEPGGSQPVKGEK